MRCQPCALSGNKIRDAIAGNSLPNTRAPQGSAPPVPPVPAARGAPRACPHKRWLIPLPAVPKAERAEPPKDEAALTQRLLSPPAPSGPGAPQAARSAGPGRAALPEKGRGERRGMGAAPARPGCRTGLPRLGTPARRDRASLSSRPSGERGPGPSVRRGASGAARPPHLSATLSSGRRGRSAPRTHWATAAIALSCPPAASARPPGSANQRAGGPGVTRPRANHQGGRGAPGGTGGDSGARRSAQSGARAWPRCDARRAGPGGGGAAILAGDGRGRCRSPIRVLPGPDVTGKV